MKVWGFVVALVTLILIVVLSSVSAGNSLQQPLLADNLSGKITRVWDGDTVTLQSGGVEYRIRLSGIDAPEHDQAYGNDASQHLKTLLLNKSVRVEAGKTDRYGRRLGKIWVQPAHCRDCRKTLDANLAMLTVGLAWWYRYYKDEQSPEDQGRYEFAELEAKSKRAGLWQDPDPTAPWDWPRGERAGSKPAGDCRIKGNISDNGRIYHMPGQRYYERTKISPSRGEQWFCSEAEAIAAGWRRARI